MRENDAMPADDAAEQPAQPWNRQRLRSANERLLLDRLRTGGAASRAQLARETGLSKPTVSSALAALEEAGLVHEVGTQTPERGRVAVLYAPILPPDTPWVSTSAAAGCAWPSPIWTARWSRAPMCATGRAARVPWRTWWSPRHGRSSPTPV